MSICFQIIRTVKFLCAISVAHYVVSPDWIDKSQKSNSLLGNYESSHVALLPLTCMSNNIISNQPNRVIQCFWSHQKALYNIELWLPVMHKARFKRRVTAVLSWLDCSSTAARH